MINKNIIFAVSFLDEVVKSKNLEKVSFRNPDLLDETMKITANYIQKFTSPQHVMKSFSDLATEYEKKMDKNQIEAAVKQLALNVGLSLQNLSTYEEIHQYFFTIIDFLGTNAGTRLESVFDRLSIQLKNEFRVVSSYDQASLVQEVKHLANDLITTYGPTKIKEKPIPHQSEETVSVVKDTTKSGTNISEALNASLVPIKKSIEELTQKVTNLGEKFTNQAPNIPNDMISTILNQFTQLFSAQKELMVQMIQLQETMKTLDLIVRKIDSATLQKTEIAKTNPPTNQDEKLIVPPSSTPNSTEKLENVDKEEIMSSLSDSLRTFIKRKE